MCVSMRPPFIIRKAILWRPTLERSSLSEVSFWIKWSIFHYRYSRIISIIWYEIQKRISSISPQFTCIFSKLSGLNQIIAYHPACVRIYDWCLCDLGMRPQILDIHYHIYGLMVRGILLEAFRKLTCPSSSLKVIKKPSLPFSSNIPHDWQPTVLYEGGNRGCALMKMESVGLHDETGLMWMLANKAVCVWKVKGEGRGQEK